MIILFLTGFVLKIIIIESTIKSPKILLPGKIVFRVGSISNIKNIGYIL